MPTKINNEKDSIFALIRSSNVSKVLELLSAANEYVSKIVAMTDFVSQTTYSYNDLSHHVNFTTKIGYTPLHEASTIGNTELMEALLQRGADVAATTKVANDL